MNIQDTVKQAIDNATEGEDLTVVIAQALEGQDSGLKAKNAELLSQIKELKSKVSTVPEDFDMDEYQKLKQAQEAANLDKLKAENKWDEIRKQLETKHAQEQQSLHTRIQSLEKALQDEMLTNQAGTAITEAGGNAALLLPHIKNHLQVHEADGNFTMRVVDAQSNQRYSMKTPGEAMSVAELIEEFKDNSTYSPAFVRRSTGGGASGMTTSGAGTGNGNANPFQRGPHFNLTEQMRLKKSNPELAKQLAAQAQSS